MVLYILVAIGVCVAIVGITRGSKPWVRMSAVLSTLAWVILVGAGGWERTPERHSRPRLPTSWPVGLVQATGPIGVKVGPLLPWIIASNSFAIRIGTDNCAPGCTPIAIASICNHFRYPTMLSKRDITVSSIHRTSTWTIGGERYVFANGPMDTGIGSFLADVGALAGTTFDPDGSGTSIAGRNAALDVLGYRHRAGTGWGDVLDSIRQACPVLLSAQVPEAHTVVADGVGLDATGATVVHLWVGLKQPPDGWYRTGLEPVALTIQSAEVDIVPSPPVTMPVIVKDPTFVTMPVIQ